MSARRPAPVVAQPDVSAPPLRRPGAEASAGSPERRPARRLADALGLSLLLAVGMALWIPRLDGPLDMRYDAGTYYVLGKALAEGRGYRLLNEPGEIQAIQYPPLLPLGAAAAQRIAGTSAVSEAGHVLRLAFCAVFLLYGAAVYVLARRFLPAFPAFLVGLVTLLHAQTVLLSDLFFTELPFAFVSVAFVLAASCARERRTPVALAGALGAAAYLLRTTGLALLGAWVGEALLARRWRSAAARAALAALPVLAWQGYVGHVQASPEYAHPAYPYQRADYQYYNVGYRENLSYVDPFAPELGKASPADWAHRIGSNLAAMPLVLGQTVTADRGWWAGFRRELEQRADHAAPPLRAVERAVEGLLAGSGPALLLIAALALAGLTRLAAVRGEPLVPLYVAFSALLLCLTPWPQQFTRYLSPLTPFLVLGQAVLLVDAWHEAPGRRGRGLRLAAASATGIFALGLMVEAYGLAWAWKKHHDPAAYVDGHGRLREHRLFFYDDAWRSQEGALEWLSGHARGSDIVGSQTPPLTYLWTGRRSVFPPAEEDSDRAQRLLDAVPVHWLVLDELEFPEISARQAEAVVRSHPELWRLSYRSPDGRARVYRRDWATGRMGAGSESPAATAPSRGSVRSGPEDRS